MRQVFKQADTNRDGVLSREEILQGFYAKPVKEKLAKLQLITPDWLAIFDAIDADGDGELSWDELAKGVAAIWAQSTPQQHSDSNCVPDGSHVTSAHAGLPVPCTLPKEE